MSRDVHLTGDIMTTKRMLTALVLLCAATTFYFTSGMSRVAEYNSYRKAHPELGSNQLVKRDITGSATLRGIPLYRSNSVGYICSDPRVTISVKILNPKTADCFLTASNPDPYESDTSLSDIEGCRVAGSLQALGTRDIQVDASDPEAKYTLIILEGPKQEMW